MDNIIIAQEIVHSMKRKKGSTGWMVMKLDLEKAYDRLRWDFIDDTLSDIGFPNCIRRVIMNCISSAEMCIMWNGKISETFKPTRGIRQGDPISPYIFVLCMERFSQAINGKVNQNVWLPILLKNNGPPLSHLFFADVLVLLSKASCSQANVIKSVMDGFCAASGHRVSASKCHIYFSGNVELSMGNEISDRLHHQQVNNLGTYLGVPLTHDRVTTSTYSYVVEKIQAKLSGWKAKLLSLAGRITLARAVLLAFPSYVMQTATLPVSLCKKIEQLVRNFIWGSSNDQKKISLAKWEELCQPRSHGGIGVRKVTSMNKSFLMKLGYNLILKTNSLWNWCINSLAWYL